MGLLTGDEAPVYELLCEAGESPFLLTADHAGCLIPKALGDLGVSSAQRERHIAWDIGIAEVTRRLSALLRATAILQTYSRLVIDCNRPPEVASAIPLVSEETLIPGNKGLDEAARMARRQAIFDPYHEAIAALIQRRARTIYVAMHSFTPCFKGDVRQMQVAVLYNRNPRLSLLLAALLRAEGDVVVAQNEPYKVSDETDYGVPVHAERNGLDYVELEIRQDLIADEAGQRLWAERLARLLPEALRQLDKEAV